MTDIDVTPRKPGRPRAIPECLIDEVISLYQAGLGYRAIAHELEKQGIFVHWSTVRRVIKKWQNENG
jgi:transposase-like protein